MFKPVGDKFPIFQPQHHIQLTMISVCQYEALTPRTELPFIQNRKNTRGIEGKKKKTLANYFECLPKLCMMIFLIVNQWNIASFLVA